MSLTWNPQKRTNYPGGPWGPMVWQMEGHFLFITVDPQSHSESHDTIRDQGGCKVARISPIGQMGKLRLGIGNHYSKGCRVGRHRAPKWFQRCVLLSVCEQLGDSSGIPPGYLTQTWSAALAGLEACL